MAKSTPLLAILLLTLLNTAPVLMGHLGGDILFHLSMLSCFADQLWQGDWYPRWCVAADGGVGSPALYFYFPLPYYITSVFYPLTWFGASAEDVYRIGVVLATAIAGCTTFDWLKRMVSPGPALLAAILFMFMPYRLEVMLYRSAYAELWCMAFLPLIPLFAEAALKGEKGAFAKLALAIAACLLCHVPTTVAVLFAVGIVYAIRLAVMPNKSSAIIAFSSALVLAALLGAFYIIPSTLLKPYVDFNEAINGFNVWANRYVRLSDYLEDGRRSVIGLLLTLLLLGLVMIICLLRQTALILSGYANTALAWGLASLVGTFLIFEISSPVWAIVHLLPPITFPWRMQIIPMFGLTALFAIYAQALATPQQRRNWKCEFGLLIGFLCLLAQFVLTEREYKTVGFVERIVGERVTRQLEHRTEWTPNESYESQDYLSFPARFTNTLDTLAVTPLVTVQEGDVRITRTYVSPNRIQISLEADTDAVLRIKQRFFPTWILEAATPAQLDMQALTLTPDEKTGWMKITVPAGSPQMLYLTQSPRFYSRWVIASYLLSLITLGALIGYLSSLRGPVKRHDD